MRGLKEYAMARPLIDHRRIEFSQAGEDGIIARIFEVVGEGRRFCCEFGAWDGVKYSNTRALVLGGWSAVLIEGIPERVEELRTNNAGNDLVRCVCAFVDTSDSSLEKLLGDAPRLDLLSIDIDGMDYSIFSSLDRLPSVPRLIVVEVNPEHGWESTTLLPDDIARELIGQPLAAFIERGRALGLRLVAYLGGNAFFLAEDAGGHEELPTVEARDAWLASMNLIKQAEGGAEYMFMRNLGLTGHPYKFNHPLLTAEHLGIEAGRAKELVRRQERRNAFRRFRRGLRRLVGRS